MEIKNIKAGVIGAIVASIPYGIMMQMMGMMQVLAGMMGSHSIIVGWMIHMMIGIIFGILFVVVFGRFVNSSQTAFFTGVGEGVLTWLIGPTIVMPMMFGGAPFSKIDLMSLFTHILFGIVIAFVYYWVSKK